ncbi:MAG: hypothetical protein R3D83_07990 [Caenibius sp.]
MWINKDQWLAGVSPSHGPSPLADTSPHRNGSRPQGRALTYDDIRHYQKINIKILTETDRIMREIELPLEGEAKAE